MRRAIVPILLIAFLLAAPSGAAADARADGLAVWRQMEIAQLQICSGEKCRKLTVKVADTPAELAQGMQYLDPEQVRANPIWFVIQPPRKMGWHMHHVALALDIVFVDANHRVVGIQRMQPERSGYGIDRPIGYALEVAAGEAGVFGLERGAAIRATHD